MQLYGYGPFVEEPFVEHVHVGPESFMGPEFFPYAPEMNEMGLFMDDDVDRVFRSLGPGVTLHIDDSEQSEYESEDDSEEVEESEHHIEGAKSMKSKKKKAEHENEPVDDAEASSVKEAVVKAKNKKLRRSHDQE